MDYLSAGPSFDMLCLTLTLTLSPHLFSVWSGVCRPRAEEILAYIDKRCKSVYSVCIPQSTNISWRGSPMTSPLQ